MEFRMLGPFEVWHDGVRLDPGDLQQRYVLVVLLLQANRPVSKERLVDIVWAGQTRPKTDLIPGYIAKLRKLLRDGGAEDVAIDTTPTGYLLRVEEDRLDVNRFTGLCDQARTAMRTGDRSRAAELLRTAVGLWRAEFLSDLDIDRVGGTAVPSLDDARMDALIDLAQLELGSGDHRWIRDLLRPAWLSDPSRQRLASLLMRALLANGDQVQAMQVYHRTRDALDEYGMETSTELREVAWLAQYGEPKTLLPPRPTRFTGRDRELRMIDSVARLAADEGPGVVWISGMPGIGKSTLAVHAAYLLRDWFPDRQLFVELNGFTPNVEPTQPAEALRRLLLDLGVPQERIPPDPKARAELYQARLAGTRTVVVLDNAVDEDHVRQLLPTAVGCLAIVTSRSIGDLVASENLHLEPLSTQDATELFGKLVGADRVRGRSDLVEAAVTRCGRVPLQIKVVAAQFRRHRRWPLDHLLQLLRAAGPWQADGTFDDAGVLACTVSYQQLDEPQRTLFRLFGQVPGHDLSVHGAAAVARCGVGQARMLLEELHRVSLLEEGAPERYHLLDPLKDFTTSVLRPNHPEEGPEATVRLLDFYLVTTATAISVAFPFDQDRQPAVHRECPVVPRFGDRQAALSWLSGERVNLVAAIRFAATDPRWHDHSWQLAVLLWRYFYTAGHLQDWTETLEQARATLRTSTNAPGKAHVQLRLSGAYWRSGELAKALELAAGALPLWTRLADTRGEADTLCAIALAAMDLGDHEQARAHFEAALAKYRTIDDERGQANALGNLGRIDDLHGEFDLSERRHLDAITLLRRINHAQGLAHALDNLGWIRQRLGRYQDALADHREALEIAIATGDRACEAYARNNLGNVHRMLGNLPDAVRCQEQARAVADDIGDPNVRTQLYLDRGETARAQHNSARALAAYRAALDLASGTGDRGQQARAHHRIGRTLHETGAHHQAAVHWWAAVSTFGELDQPEEAELRQVLAGLGCACAVPPDVA